MIKILHTSDWHIGRSLYNRKRYSEHQAFLDWLLATILKEEIELLIVAGDIFDTSTPSNKAQELYYRFLCRVSNSSCRHIVIIGGNHDSPSFLNAPKELLKFLNVHVVGAITDRIDDEIILIKDEKGSPQIIVCAVPYLRERDIRVVESGEDVVDKNRKITNGIGSHYQQVYAKAKEIQKSLSLQIPLVVMGHLFTTGGKTSEGDGVRDLYIGSLAQIGCEIFPDNINYVALGHLHVPQMVNKKRNRRYSGSPLAMSFSEAKQIKLVLKVEFTTKNTRVSELEIPCFQKLIQIAGNLEEIFSQLAILKLENSDAWLEIIYQGEQIVSGLREKLENSIGDSNLEILRVKNMPVIDLVRGKMDVNETLEDLTEKDVFDRCLKAHKVPINQQNGLKSAYQEILISYHESDDNAE